MQARSAVIDLYGDHLVDHGYWAPIAAVVALARSCGIQPPATRTAVSRLTVQEWLIPEPHQGVRGYAATALAQGRLDRARQRIYAHDSRPWSGDWHVVVVGTPGERAERDRLSAALGYLGYGRLAPATWVSPRPSEELEQTMQRLGVGWAGFTGPSHEDPVALVVRVWDLADLGRAYREFSREVPALSRVRTLAPGQAYAVRTDLVHRWRKFMFTDPGLPPQALPADWPGHTARHQFLEAAAALLPGARIFVDEALVRSGATGDPTEASRTDG